MDHPFDARPQVLVAEDDPDVRGLLGRLLGSRGCAAVMVGSGEEAFARAADGDWDLLLTDLQMPGMDGIELARRVRAHERATARGTARLPIVAVTAHTLARYRQEADRAGMDGFLEKPLSRAAFDGVVAPRVAPRRRVLVVDDAPEGRRLLSRRLPPARWRVVLAATGEDGLAHARRRPFDLAILDLELPGMSGAETARALRALPGGAQTHLLALTAHEPGSPEERAARAAGVAEVLHKPVSRGRLERALAPASVRPPRSSLTPPPRPAAGQTVLVAADLADLVPDFVAHRRDDLGRLEALLRDADAAELAEGARQLGHGMRGSGAGYGFMRISELGAAIEAAADDRAALERLTRELRHHLGDLVVVVDSGGGVGG